MRSTSANQSAQVHEVDSQITNTKKTGRTKDNIKSEELEDKDIQKMILEMSIRNNIGKLENNNNVKISFKMLLIILLQKFKLTT